MTALLLILLATALFAEGTADFRAAQDAYLKGMLLERRGDAAGALKAYEEALAKDPQSVFLAREAAELSLESGDLPRAQRWAEAAAALAPVDAGAQELLGQVLWARGEAARARAAFEAALKADPGHPDAVYALAQLDAETAPEKARRRLKAFLQSSPDAAAETHFQFAQVELKGGRVKAAVEHLKQSIALEPDSLPARYALAQAYETLHSTQAALDEYEKLAKLEPQNAALFNHIGQLLAVSGRWEQARERFLAAKALAPADPAANHWLALEAERRGERLQAAEYLRASAALTEDPGLNLRLSYHLSHTGRLKEAVRVLEEARRRWPQNDQIAYFLALGYDDLRRTAEAARLLREVLAVKPDSREARYQLAVVLEKGGRFAEAEREFRELIARRPDDASALNYLGYSLADRGVRLEEAEALARRAVSLDPQNGAYRDSLGWALFRQGRSTEAAAHLASALALLPEDETIWDHWGDVAAARGNPRAAWLSWKKSLALKDGEVKVPAKVRAAEARWTSVELGSALQDYLAASHGGLVKLAGLCELEGHILARAFGYSAFFTFRAPHEIDLDLLGPLFTPLLRARLNAEGFVMDPLRLDGIKPEETAEAVSSFLSLMRDYLSGKAFEARPARARRSWLGRRRWLEAGEWRLDLDSRALRLEGLQKGGAGYALKLKEHGRVQGRLVPRVLSVEGRGFSFGVRFDDVKIEFRPAAPNAMMTP